MNEVVEIQCCVNSTKFRTFERVLPREQGLSEGQAFTRIFISILVPTVETHLVQPKVSSPYLFVIFIRETIISAKLFVFQKREDFK